MTTAELIAAHVQTLQPEVQARVLAYVELLERAAPARRQVIADLLVLAERASADFGRPCTLDDINAELDRDRHDRA